MTGLNKRTLRIARPAEDLTATCEFYCDILGFEKLGSFEGHQGFDGVMLGHVGMPYHLEFTYNHNHPASPVSTSEDLLIFYIAEKQQWEEMVGKLKELNIPSEKNENPYWDTAGQTFRDPNGYRIVLQFGDWGKAE